jgi:DNA polymerase-1
MLKHFDFQQASFHPVLRMMNRGIRIDLAQRASLKQELIRAQIDRQETLNSLVGHELNPKSPKQLSDFFYHDLGIAGVKNLTGDSFTTNSPAMATIAAREPLLQPVCQLIVELRSIGVFLSTFINADLDTDGRMRCSFSIAGTNTFRLASSENAFGSGMNLQNIPVAEKAKIKSATYIHLPNIRKLFIPDEGYTFFDMDLDRADLQVVVWEANDAELKLALHKNLDMHCFNACAIFDLKGIPYEELAESHPNYRDHRARIGEAARNKAKAGVHATNYGVGDSKLAQALGISTHDASNFRRKWFAAHPGIREWHLRVDTSASTRGYIENAFGARFYVLGRKNLPELLAWGPQSTVARVINQAMINIDAAEQRGETSIQLLIQVHDSLAGQFLTAKTDEEIANLKKLASVEIPYPDPLIIPVGINTSSQSWGHCK